MFSIFRIFKDALLAFVFFQKYFILYHACYPGSYLFIVQWKLPCSPKTIKKPFLLSPQMINSPSCTYLDFQLLFQHLLDISVPVQYYFKKLFLSLILHPISLFFCVFIGIKTILFFLFVLISHNPFQESSQHSL